MSDATEEEEEEDLNYCKLQTLKELFPQKSDQALLEVQYYNYQEISIDIPCSGGFLPVRNAQKHFYCIVHAHAACIKCVQRAQANQ